MHVADRCEYRARAHDGMTGEADLG
jgi:hypothetical protein